MTPITIAQALQRAEQKLSKVEDRALVARSLLAHVLKCDQTYLFGYANSALSKAELACFEQLLFRAAKNEPLAYLIGHKEFFGFDFMVTPDVLIPRPETEGLVQAALRFTDGEAARRRGGEKDRSSNSNPSRPSNPPTSPLCIVDVGTGSGCIAISLAKQLPDAQVYAVDVSEAALKVAKTNADRLDATNVTFLHGCLLEPLQGLTDTKSIDIIVANLPYISDKEFAELPENIRNFEPELALRTNSTDPDALNEELLKQSKHWLKPDALLAYETTNGQMVVREKK